MQQDKQYFIYTLTNPFTDAVYYVGQSSNLTQRLKQFPSCKRVNKDTGEIDISRPVMEILEPCSSEDRFKTEGYWINQFYAWGFYLQNQFIPGLGFRNNYYIKQNVSVLNGYHLGGGSRSNC